VQADPVDPAAVDPAALDPAALADAAPPAVDADGVLDFTVQRRPVRFRVDADVFEAIPALPAMMAFELSEVAVRLRDAPTTAARRAALLEVFGKILAPASLERFVERLGSGSEPIDAAQLIRIVQGLLGHYGLRPTQPSPGSSPAPPAPASGTPSTDGSPSPASILAGFPSTGS
jgi:hypothetical protein